MSKPSPTPTSIKGDCCIEFEDLIVQDGQDAELGIEVENLFSIGSEINYHINFGDGDVSRNNKDKISKDRYTRTIKHRYHNIGNYNTWGKKVFKVFNFVRIVFVKNFFYMNF